MQLHAFKAGRLELLEVIAGQAAISITNAQLNDNLELEVLERSRDEPLARRDATRRQRRRRGQHNVRRAGRHHFAPSAPPTQTSQTAKHERSGLRAVPQPRVRRRLAALTISTLLPARVRARDRLRCRRPLVAGTFRKSARSLSCRGRGFCPGCLGQKMVQTSANRVERVFSIDVPPAPVGRHFPFELRARLGFDAPLLSAVSGGVIDTLRAFYERRRRDHLGPLPPVPIACASGGPLCHRPRLPAEARARGAREHGLLLSRSTRAVRWVASDWQIVSSTH
jgi:hypothetical protein